MERHATIEDGRYREKRRRVALALSHGACPACTTDRRQTWHDPCPFEAS